MRSQEKLLVALALIGVVGGVTIVAEIVGNDGTGGFLKGLGSPAEQHPLKVDQDKLNSFPRDPLPRTSPHGWVTEYPSAALMSEMEGYLTVLLTVDPFGEVANCEVKESSGIQAFDQRTCAALVNNARFYPALDDKQVPVTGVFEQSVRYMIPSKN